MATIAAARGLGLARVNGAHLVAARAATGSILLNYRKPLATEGLHATIVAAALSQKRHYKLLPTNLLKRAKMLADKNSKKTPSFECFIFSVADTLIKAINKDTMRRLAAGSWAVAKTAFYVSLLVAFNIGFMVVWGPYQ